MKITVGDLEKVFGVDQKKKEGSYEVSVLSHTYLNGEIHSVTLRDKHQLCVEFPVSIFKSNAEIIPAVGDILYFFPADIIHGFHLCTILKKYIFQILS